ncbi:hypothetical protein TSAR_004520 [Trichomalopsis sarcophagae]|uniref:Uncharacterized protein n=1 Tax=Trichomalopsis sarcophagae TaxID=543379 RepID=A0A232F232_9HYME|nr:hypothetical protein TSAR_004520 [Trichomalopsis sarcophagae]
MSQSYNVYLGFTTSGYDYFIILDFEQRALRALTSTTFRLPDLDTCTLQEPIKF